MTNSELIARGKSVIEIEIDALQQIVNHLDDDFALAVNTLAESIQNRGKIVVIGIGKSGNVGHKIAATLNSTGSTAVVLNSQNALHGDLGMLSDGDAVIALSYSGETAELIDLIPFIKRFDVNIISITKSKDSSLAKYSDVTVCTPIRREACPLNLAPTSSSTAALVMGDALAMALLDKRGFTQEDFARYHPGGSLGRALLTKVTDIMRQGINIAIVHSDATVADAISAMSTARTGSCIIVSPDKKSLCGIYTHGDFARNFLTGEDIGSQPVEDFMNKTPISIRQEALAVEAVKIFEKHRIDDIIVLNAQKEVVGLVDSQDLARLKIV
ncbi:KpsF/GutQ family sugar-phosphate isomerase [Rubritalea sp.]|uniref:KpsF/GutQ family sugar-phosphate isomerase n=1 Tax=Rubritalea sp. TaxID=2109375 RepID=UPI003EF4BFFD